MYLLYICIYICIKKVWVLCSFLQVLDDIAFIYNLAPFIFNPVRMPWSSFLIRCLLILHLFPLATEQVTFAIYPEDKGCLVKPGIVLLSYQREYCTQGKLSVMQWWLMRLMEQWNISLDMRHWNPSWTWVYCLKLHWHLIVSAYPVNVPEWNMSKMFSKTNAQGSYFNGI